MQIVSLKRILDMQVPRINPTFVRARNTEGWVMVECGKERLVRDDDPPRPVEEVSGARIMQHVVHEPALYDHFQGALYRCEAMWRRPRCCPPTSVSSETIRSAIFFMQNYCMVYKQIKLKLTE